MASATAQNNGNGTITVTATGVAAGATSVRIVNTTTGATLGEVPYSSGPTSLTDLTCKCGGTVNSYSVTFYSGGTVVGTLTCSATPTFFTLPLAVSISGPYSGCTWYIPSDNNSLYSRSDTSLYYKIGSGAYVLYASGLAVSGSIPSSSVFVGYSTTVTWKVVHTMVAGGYPSDAATNTGSDTTPAAPPSPPNPPTNLAAADVGTSVGLTWTGSVGGATGYEVSRSINGGAYTTLGNTGATGYTDGSPGLVRPIVYRVRAYNFNSSGTAYSSYVAVTAGGRADSTGVLIA